MSSGCGKCWGSEGRFERDKRAKLAATVRERETRGSGGWSRYREQTACLGARLVVCTSLRREAVDLPGIVGLAAVAEAVVEAVGAALPELDQSGHENVTAPAIGQGDRLIFAACFESGVLPFKGGSVRQDPALFTGRGRELAGSRAGLKICGRTFS